jgi:hypothetical protein
MKYIPYLLLALLSLLLVPVATATSAEEPPYPEPTIVSQQTLPDGRNNVVVNIPAWQDTYIASGAPNANFGGSQTLFIGFDQFRANQGAMRSYVQFDVSPFQNVQVTRAELWMHQSFCSPGSDQAMGAIVRHLNSGWNENSLTWANANAAWGGVSAEGSIACRGSGYGTADVTELVRQWVAGTRTNFGFMIQGDETPRDRQRSWNSRESGVNTAPFLRLEYNTCTTTSPISGMNGLPALTDAPEFNVTWWGDDPGGQGIDHFDLQYRLQNKTDWREWLNYARGTSALFRTQDVFDFASGDVVEFRVRSVNRCGVAQGWPGGPQAATRVLTARPTANVLPFGVAILQSHLLNVSWAGNAQGNPPVTAFDVHFRHAGGEWQSWVSATTFTTATFSAPQQGFYEFRTRAYDANSRVGDWSAPVGVFFDLNGSMRHTLYLPVMGR